MINVNKNESGFNTPEALLIGLIVIVVSVLGWYVWNSKRKVDNTYNTINNTQNNNVDKTPVKKITDNSPPSDDYSKGVKFTGTITADDCYKVHPLGDVGCSLTIDGAKISVVHGNRSVQHPWGQLIGFTNLATKDYSGKTVEVYAHKPADKTYTLEGSADYYVKLMN